MTVVPFEDGGRPTEMLSIESITIGERKREIVEARVEVLKDSISELGLMQPIVVGEDMMLIAGRHRLEACRRLGFEKVPAVRKVYGSLEAELAEIDENLVRFELTDLERSIQYARRKVLYETKYPQLRKTTENSEGPVKSFVEDTAEKTGRSTTTVRDEANLGKEIVENLSPEVRSLIAPTKVAKNKTDIKRLLDEPDPEVRLEAAKEINRKFNEGVDLSAQEALSDLGRTPKKRSVEDGEEVLLASLRKNVRLLEISVGSNQFEKTAKNWTTEGLQDIREEFFRISELATRGIDSLTDIIESR